MASQAIVGLLANLGYVGHSVTTGHELLREAAKNSPELAAAMETWKEIKFEFDTVDKLDVAHK